VAAHSAPAALSMPGGRQYWLDLLMAYINSILHYGMMGDADFQDSPYHLEWQPKGKWFKEE
jgi:hypothetical protein